MILEVIARDLADARAAARGGADRLELVGDMSGDGVSPSAETVREVCGGVDLPVRVMLRGAEEFTIEEADLDRLCGTAQVLREAGAGEFVLGYVRAGQLDVAALRRLAAAVPGCPWTLHRAFDLVADPGAAHRVAAALPGLDRILTAGDRDGLSVGGGALAARASWQDRGPRWIAGGGLLPEHVPALRAAGVQEFHTGRWVRHGNRWDAPIDPVRVRALRAAVASGA